jgi:hypothetical protein
MEMNTEERLRRRAVFDSIADVYDAGRPSYPDELFDDLLSRLEIPTGTPPAVLEVGCGPDRRADHWWNTVAPSPQ